MWLPRLDFTDWGAFHRTSWHCVFKRSLNSSGILLVEKECGLLMELVHLFLSLHLSCFACIFQFSIWLGRSCLGSASFLNSLPPTFWTVWNVNHWTSCRIVANWTDCRTYIYVQLKMTGQQHAAKGLEAGHVSPWKGIQVSARKSSNNSSNFSKSTSQGPLNWTESWRYPSKKSKNKENWPDRSAWPARSCGASRNSSIISLNFSRSSGDAVRSNRDFSLSSTDSSTITASRTSSGTAVSPISLAPRSQMWTCSG